jgi:hypothetical protein
MRRLTITAGFAVLGLAMVAAGCLPNRAAVSPDGKTFYFSLNEEGGGFEVKGSANLYALDIESARLTALTDGRVPKAWCALSSDGGILAYMVGSDEKDQSICTLSLKDGVSLAATGYLQKSAYPWVIPGRPPHLLTMEQDSADKPPQWALYSPNVVPLGFPADHAAAYGNVGLATNRFAVALFRPLPAGGSSLPGGEEDAEGVEADVYVVDLTKPEAPPAKPPAPGAKSPAAAATKAGAAPVKEPWPKVVLAAKWQDLKEKGPIIDLAFSSDGKRLVAAILGAGENKDEARFFDLDPTGQAPPKVLFDAYKAYYPQVAPDGKGIVYLRTSPRDEKFREVVLWRPDAKEPVLLARLPGEMGKAYTTWFWMTDGRLRIYHLSDDGVHLVETAADGTGAKERLLTHDRLKVQRALADFERAIAKMPDLSQEKWPEPTAAQMKAVTDPLKNAQKPAADASEAAWKAAAVWEEVSAIAPPAPTEIAAPPAAKPAAPEKAPAPTPAAP